MKTKLQRFKAWLCMLVVMILCAGNAWGETVTYKVTENTAVTTTGTAPQGSSASYSQTYGTACQMTKDNTTTLTLSGFSGCTITGVTISTKTNKSAGEGSFTVTIGGTKKGSLSVKEIGNTYTNKDITVTSTKVGSGETIVIAGSCTTNSVYCQSYTITYTASTQTALGTPANLSSSNVTGTTADLSWGAVANASGYKVKIGSTEYNTNTNSYSATGLETDTKYYWSVKALAGSSESYSDGNYSNESSFTTSFVAVAGTYDIALNNSLYEVTSGSNSTEQSATKRGITVVSGCKLTATNKTYYDTNHIRYYADSYLKLTAPTGFVITSVVFDANGTWNSGPSASVGTYTNLTKTWTGSASQIDFSFSDQNRVGSIAVTYAAPETPTKTLSSIAVTGTPEEFWVGDTFNHNGMTVTATYNDKTTEDVTSSASFSTPDMTTGGEKEITVTYSEKTAYYNITVKTIANTAETAYTTAEAKAKIDAGKDLASKVYVKGTVSQVDKFDETNKFITYWLDEKAFEVYKGKNNNGADFSSIDDIAVGAEVVVYGTIKKYSSTYEMDQGNWLVSYTAPAVEKSNATISFTSKYNLFVGENDTYSVTYNGNGTVTATSSNESVATVEYASGSITVTALKAGQTTITVSAPETDTYTAAEKKYTLYVKLQHTVTWSVNGTETTEKVTEGASITFTTPTNNIPEGYEFVGWAAATISGTQDTAPTFVTSATMGTEDVTYYAVFAVVSGSTSTSTSVDEVVAGDYYIIDTYGGPNATYATGVDEVALSYKAMTGSVVTTNGQPNSKKIVATDITAAITANSNGSITLDKNNAVITEEMVYTLTITDGKYCLSQGTNKIGCSASSTDLTNTNTNTWQTIESENGRHKLKYTYTDKNTEKYRYLYYQEQSGADTQSRVFKNYTSATFNDVNVAVKYGSGSLYFIPVNDSSVSYSDYCTTVSTAAEGGTFNFVATDGTSYWATFSSDHVVKFDEAFISDDETCMASVKAYAVTTLDNELYMTDQYNVNNDGNYTYIPKNTGILLKCTVEEGEFDGKIPFEYVDDVDGYLNDVEDNDLHPAGTTLTGEYLYYKLAYGDYTAKTDLGFYWGATDGAAFKVKTGTAYLAVPKSSGSNMRGFAFGGDETITGIVNAINNTNAAIYDLSGRRVVAPVRGQLYISNGQKFIQK